MLQSARIKVAVSDESIRKSTNTATIDDTILILVHTKNRELRLYQLIINWLYASAGGPGVSAPQSATFVIRRLKTIYRCSPLDRDTDSDLTFLMTPASAALLSHLEILPRPETRNKEDSYITIVAAFSYVAPPNEYNNSELREEAFSIISRWELVTERAILHSSFDTLASKKTNSSSNNELKVSFEHNARESVMTYSNP